MTHLPKLTNQTWSRQAIELLIVIALLGGMAYQLFAAARADGVTFDEPIHLLSGYVVLTDHHILIDPDHPPLIKAIAALPLLWLDPTLPDQAANMPPDLADLDVSTYTAANGWGWKMLFTSGNDPDQLVLAGRIMMSILTLIAAILLWRWTRQLFGIVAGLATLALFSVDPTVLAHGHYINTDMGATLFWLATLASLWQFLTKRSQKWLILTGLALGGGLLSKFSLMVLLGLVPLLILAWLIYHRRQPSAISLNWPRLSQFTHAIANHWSWLSPSRQIVLSYGLAAAAILLLALAVVWLTYGLLWLSNPSQNPLWILASSSIAPVLAFLPGMHAKGLAVIGGDRSGYLLGQCYKGSRLEYFPILTFFKMPLGSLFLLLGGVVSLGIAAIRRSNTNRQPFIAWFLGIAIAVFYGLSMVSGVNIGFRHILPAYTLLLMVAGYAAAKLWHLSGQAWQKWLGKGLVIALLVGTMWSSWSVSPYFLPYYNELSGEPHNRPWVADDSNTDWGESSKALAEFVQARGITEIALSNYVGWTEARYLGIPLASGIGADDQDYKGWIAISRSSVVYHYCRLNNDWSWLIDNHDPVAIIGGAINIYYLE